MRHLVQLLRTIDCHVTVQPMQSPYSTIMIPSFSHFSTNNQPVNDVPCLLTVTRLDSCIQEASKEPLSEVPETQIPDP